MLHQEEKPFLLHLSATPAINAAYLHVEVDTETAVREFPDTAGFPVVEPFVDTSTRAACRFFPGEQG